MPLGDVVERHLLRPHQAAHAQLRRLDAEVARERVERQLQREADAGARDAAVRQDRRLVGRDRIGAAAIMREVVEAGQDAADLSGLETGRERIGGIGSGIDRRLAVEPEQAAVAIGIGGEAVMVLAAVGAGGEALAPVLDPAQRMAELERRPGQRDFLAEQHALVAEAAADIGRDDADAPFLDAEAFGKAGADDVRLLGRAGDDDLVDAGVVPGDDAASFQRAHRLACSPQLAHDRSSPPWP